MLLNSLSSPSLIHTYCTHSETCNLKHRRNELWKMWLPRHHHLIKMYISTPKFPRAPFPLPPRFLSLSLSLISVTCPSAVEFEIPDLVPISSNYKQGNWTLGQSWARRRIEVSKLLVCNTILKTKPFDLSPKDRPKRKRHVIVITTGFKETPGGWGRCTVTAITSAQTNQNWK